ncbi:MAG: zinc ribbon domain-containing protein [Bacilli bacterium]|jgi:uncharacterized OB-fold protein|nr:zinc ribbon domain-containing protein [Bacilli bacterium]MCH4228088.1 zinc ribbon domain-containing protein [Bacilli bacterium]MCI2054606.1 zinc ribbon domain-containing protein [Bacilli bacterium]
MFCLNCGKEISDEVSYCPYCGAKVKKEAPKEEGHITPEVVEVNDNSKDAPKHSSAWTFGLVSIILGALSMGELGLIFGIIGLIKSKEKVERAMNIVGIVLSVCLFWVHYRFSWN